MRIKYKEKTLKVQSINKLGDKFSILGFWEKKGAIPKNSHVIHLLLKEEEFTRLE